MTENSNHQPNRLINETSPYLLQHAHNPVDWYAWTEEALERARSDDLPILLSIGYSACHWCHVMERESFESEEIAKIMNSNYVCIKVDREERPDLDKVYQSAHQLFNKRGGGWPLTAILTPDELIPLHVGTYYPPQPRHGMPGFGELLTRIAEVYKEKDRFLPEHAVAVKDAFARLSATSQNAESSLDGELMQRAVEHLINDYDPVFGGFGEAPKFPHPTQIEILLSYWQRTNHSDSYSEKRSISMAVHTLEAMASGGMYDQLGGGFYRYSVDARWQIPHFEKMLYDTAQLMPLYVDAGFLAKRKDFHEVAIQSGEWVMREMQSSDGGYFSAIDADSEGEEGKFYVWTLDELNPLLTEEELDVLTVRYGLRGVPNFEGKWHFQIANSITDVAHRVSREEAEVIQLLDQAKQKLFETRSERVPPLCDDKVLSSWNGLMIKAMARAGRYLKRSDFVDSAERALKFIQKNMWQNDRLLATARDGRAHLNAYLDDYAFVADGAIELLQARWNDTHLDFAEQLVKLLLTHFKDPDTSAFFFTSDDHEKLLYRALPTHDDATPSGNGVAAQVLLELSYLTGEQHYRECAIRINQALQNSAHQIPTAFGSSLIAIEESIAPGPTLVIHGDSKEAKSWVEESVETGSQRLSTYSVPNSAKRVPATIPAILSDSSGQVAYLCEGYTCSPPCRERKELINLLPARKTR